MFCSHSPAPEISRPAPSKVLPQAPKDNVQINAPISISFDDVILVSPLFKILEYLRPKLRSRHSFLFFSYKAYVFWALY